MVTLFAKLDAAPTPQFKLPRPYHRWSFDFELKRCLFELDGKQHFEPIEWFGGQPKFEAQRRRDIAKARAALSHGHRLVHIHSGWLRTPEADQLAFLRAALASTERLIVTDLKMYAWLAECGTAPVEIHFERAATPAKPASKPAPVDPALASVAARPSPSTTLAEKPMPSASAASAGTAAPMPGATGVEGGCADPADAKEAKQAPVSPPAAADDVDDAELDLSDFDDASDASENGDASDNDSDTDSGSGSASASEQDGDASD